MVGLANLFADCPRLQRHAILVIVAGSVVVEDAPDDDGAACARALHALFDTGRLPPGTARWIRAQANPVRNGELYRMVADTRGAFAMPSLYEVSGVGKRRAGRGVDEKQYTHPPTHPTTHNRHLASSPSRPCRPASPPSCPSTAAAPRS